MGDAPEAAEQMLLDMGFDKAAIARVLKKTSSIDYAITLLFEGLPAAHPPRSHVRCRVCGPERPAAAHRHAFH